MTLHVLLHRFAIVRGAVATRRGPGPAADRSDEGRVDAYRRGVSHGSPHGLPNRRLWGRLRGLMGGLVGAHLTSVRLPTIDGVARSPVLSRMLPCMNFGMLFGIAFLAGCSVAQPEVRTKALEVGRVAGDLAEVDLVIELRNPGADEIELVQYDYTLSVGDGARYGGRWAALRALPPGQIVEARIPAVLPATSVEGGRTWSVSGTLRYRDPSSIVRILYEAGILKTEVGFSGSGAGATRVNAAATATAPEAPLGGG